MTPFARMHSESLSAFCGFPVWIAKPELGAPRPDPVDGPPVLSAVPPRLCVVDDAEEWLLVVLEVLTLATPGLLAPPPQPPTTIATATTAATDARARGEAPRRRRSVKASAGRIAHEPFASTLAGIGGKK